MHARTPKKVTINPYTSACAAVLVLAGLSGCRTPAETITPHECEQLWHRHYQDAWESIRQKNFATAQGQLLLALQHAEHFEPPDKRLAGTLDDLGLVFYSLNNDGTAEQMQGRAVGELLLSRGVNDPKLMVLITRLGYSCTPCGSRVAVSMIKLPLSSFLSTEYDCCKPGGEAD